MAATSFDLAQVDLLALLGSRTSLKKVAATDGGEFHGPCPWCGGKDRFMVWPAREHPGYHCRQCGRSGDALDYIQETEGLSFEQAVERLQLRNPTRTAQGKPKTPTVSHTVYKLRDAHGQDVAEHVRVDYSDGSKRFIYRRNGRNGLEGLDPSDLPLYGSEDISTWTAGQTVVIVEGEKKRDMLTGLGFYSLGTLGSNTTPSEATLSPLQGFDVVLAPDNDAENKAGPIGWLHMDRTARRLVGMGIRPRVIEPAIFPPDGGGLDDYLQLGHGADDVAAVLRDAPLYTADGAEIVTQRDELTYEVDIPASAGGRIWILAEDVSIERHSLTADVTVQLRAGTSYSRRWGSRMDFRSASSRDSCARELGRLLGGGGRSQAERAAGENWTDVLMTAGMLIRDRLMSYDPTVDINDVQAEDADVHYRLEQLLEEGEAMVLFGDGGSLKSYLALALGLSAGLGGDFSGLPISHPGPILFVDYETNARTVRRRVDRIMAGLNMQLPPGLFHYFPAHGRPLPALVNVLRKRISENDIGLTIIDSAAYACDDEAEKAIAATRYFNALGRLSVTTLTIAHVSKQGDDDKPFGSSFWHHGPRSTWNIKRANGTSVREHYLTLYNRKMNNDAPPARPLTFRLQFDGRSGPVTIERTNAQQMEGSLAQRIRQLLLLNGSHTAPEIARALSAAPASVRKELSAHNDQFTTLDNPASRHTPLWGVVSYD